MDCDAYRDRMLDVLYGEASDEDRRAVEDHHGSCPDCREELAALRGLRRRLAAWSVPATAVPRRPAAAAPAAMALALAACAVLAVGGAALAGAELRRDERGWSLRVGRPASDEMQDRLDAQEARHRQEVERLRAALAAPPRLDARDVLGAVRQMVEESERRQGARLQEALAELAERTEAQRRYDLAQVSAGLSYLDGKAGLHAARTTELMGQVLLASQEK